ncbi:RraA family protein [Falsochrobactrum sp. TDYN1]|uniref:Putative 4-hydroxy-4-methyl-2-oxoglutarate aldolase n=1 Tax=Falsochrobactrum tianjinense TaxID=2706015 RepID=A0A949PQ16_9HYPH|nr:RraA family protein [Falsochrobactrum sp. TDYN1]MBV2144918.1 RraA family protein [Falsochrobactrum sp. TDYN1]
MTNYDYARVNWAAIERLSRWYSGDIQDVMDKHGFYGFLQGISLQSALKPGQVICGPVHTVLYEKSTRTGQPQDVYHGTIDSVVKGGILLVDSSCAEGSGTGELMSTGAKTAGAAATIVNGTVRDIAEVKKLDYPLFGRGVSPVGVSGRMEPAKSQIDLNINDVRVRPGDVIFADISGVVVIPEELVAIIADDADANANAENQCRQRILSGEKLQSIWPLGATGPV